MPARNLLWALLTVPVMAAEDPRALVEKALSRDNRANELLQNYTYLETEIERQWDHGQLHKTESKTWEVLSLYGEPYKRLIKRNGAALEAGEEEKEKKKLDRLMAERQKETLEEREKRIQAAREKRRKSRDVVQEIPKAYDFREVGRTEIGGYKAIILEATPRADYKPRSREGSMLKKFKGKLYLAEGEATLLRVEGEAMEDLTFGLFLARLNKGATFTLENQRVNNELWFPRTARVRLEARLALVKKLRVDIEVNYGEFRKFQSESKLVPGAVD